MPEPISSEVSFSSVAIALAGEFDTTLWMWRFTSWFRSSLLGRAACISGTRKGMWLDSHWYPKGLAVEERQDKDVKCAPWVVSRGTSDETWWGYRVCRNESGGRSRGIEALCIIREVCEVPQTVHFARNELRVVCAHLLR